jgi:hypothetical protein
MESQLNLEASLNKLVKVVFRETPDAPVEIRKGRLVGFDHDFLQLQSHENVHLINRQHIITLKVFGGGGG